MLNEFFDCFVDDIQLIHTTEKNLNHIFCSFEELLINFDYLIKNLLPKNHKSEFESILGTGTKFVVEKLKGLNTANKRQNVLNANESYVKPETCAIGLTWKSKANCGKEIVAHDLQQTTYQYVSIIGSIKSYFVNDYFYKSYIDYNENRKHKCENDVYVDYCCGSLYKSSEILTSTTLQIQLAIDEFEPCHALKSKKGLHKQCAIYFEIRNVEPKLKSNINNIYLVALVNAKDMKLDDVNKIASKITEELKILEIKGVEIRPGVNLNGVLINISSDNLGANTIFGFVECFVATYYCRICELSSTECKVAIEEIPEKLRQKSNYESCLKLVNEYHENNKIPNYKETKGVKKNCEFNSLRNFHILDNCNLDIMHDVNEGVIPFFTQKFLKLIISKKFATSDELIALCRDFNYGHIWKKYKPSMIKIDSRNLSQNAMQNYCLIVHLPFILFKFKASLGNDWSALECLLQILQILYSYRVRESDLYRLNNLLKEHLSYLISTGSELMPKHHMTTHYPQLIRKVGPLIHAWMMRFESKHKVFTDFVHLSCNYKNISYTLAKRHQAKICKSNQRTFKIAPEISKSTYDITKSPHFNHYKSYLFQAVGGENNVCGLKFIFDGSLEYRTGLILIEENEPFEILHVLSSNFRYFVLCIKFKILQFEKSLNSIEIEKVDGSYKLFDISQIKSYKTYDKVFCQQRMYIIANTLDVFSEP